MKYSEDIMDSNATYQGRIAELPSSSELELLLSHRSFSILNVFTRTGERKKTKKHEAYLQPWEGKMVKQMSG